MRTGRKPDCSFPMAGFKFARTISPLNILAMKKTPFPILHQPGIIPILYLIWHISWQDGFYQAWSAFQRLLPGSPGSGLETCVFQQGHRLFGQFFYHWNDISIYYIDKEFSTIKKVLLNPEYRAQGKLLNNEYRANKIYLFIAADSYSRH